MRVLPSDKCVSTEQSEFFIGSNGYSDAIVLERMSFFGVQCASVCPPVVLPFIVDEVYASSVVASTVNELVLVFLVGWTFLCPVECEVRQVLGLLGQRVPGS